MSPNRGASMELERRMLRDSVAGFRKREIDERARELDEEAASGVVEKLFGGLAPLGLATALLSEETGGQGMDTLSFCQALRETARGSAGFATVLLSHNLALRALEAAGAGETAASCAAAGVRAALCWPARAEGGGSFAPYVPGGAGAGLLVSVTGEGEVRAAAPGAGARVEELERPMGLRASRPAAVKLDRGAETARALDENRAAELEIAALLGVGAVALGISDHAFERARSYARERWQACDYIINHEQVRLMLGSMLAGIETGQAAIRTAAASADEGAGALSAALAVKVLVCDRAVRDAEDAVQVHGGYGYMRDYGMELLMRDARACQVYPRTPRDELLLLLARA